MSYCISADFAKNQDGTKCTVPYCKVTNGECQFIEGEHWRQCSIYLAYVKHQTNGK